MSTYQGNQYVEAAHHGGERTSTQFIVVHTTENDQGSVTALDIAEFFAHETNPTSAHGVADNTQLVRCVTDDTVAYHCGTHGNAKGVGLEHIGKAAYTATDWDTPYTNQMLVVSARQVAAWCRLYAIPPVKLNAKDLLLGHKGICGHNDVRAAWPLETTHTDPGMHWPWGKHIGLVRAMLASPAPPTVKWKDPEMFMYKSTTGHAVLVEGGKQVQLEPASANTFSLAGVPYVSAGITAAQEVVFVKAYGPVNT